MRTCSLLGKTLSKIGSSSAFSDPETIRSTELPPPKTVSASPPSALPTLQPLNIVSITKIDSRQPIKPLFIFIVRPLPFANIRILQSKYFLQLQQPIIFYNASCKICYLSKVKDMYIWSSMWMEGIE